MASVFARLRPCLRAVRTALLFRCGYLFQQVSEILTRCGLVHREAQRLGHERWCGGFRLRIAKVERDYGMD